MCLTPPLSGYAHRENNLDFFFFKIWDCRKVHKQEDDFQNHANKLHFVCALWTRFYYCIYSSLSLLKSASQWVIKCEIGVHTFLTNHLTARLQKELERSCQRWWLFLTHCNSQKKKKNNFWIWNSEFVRLWVNNQEYIWSVWFILHQATGPCSHVACSLSVIVPRALNADVLSKPLVSQTYPQSVHLAIIRWSLSTSNANPRLADWGLCTSKRYKLFCHISPFKFYCLCQFVPNDVTLLFSDSALMSMSF